MQPWQAVLDYWFGDENPPSPDKQKRWFSGGKATDQEIETRFGQLHQQLTNGLPSDWPHTGETLCAAILVLDQFSRNLFRSQAKAFASDELACTLSDLGWEQQRFAELPSVWQAFTLMPYMHSEELGRHDLCLARLDQLQQSFPDDTILTGFYSSAQSHRDIIAQFGRYPHRNAVLNRPATEAEQHYLVHGGQRFGQ